MKNIYSLLNEKDLYTRMLNRMNFGTIEIRIRDSKKYIYVHYRLDGRLRTKYVGEYTKELEKNIIEDTKCAKQYKKRINEINKQLKAFKYKANALTDKIKLNIDYARSSLVDTIYKQAKLEGVVTTYSDTESIIKGGVVKNMTVSDINKIVNLKHAWDFILSEGVISYPTNFNILCQINELVEENFSYSAGKLRSIPVKIGGSTYIPPIPFETVIKEELDKILNSNLNTINKAIKLVLYVMKKQLFLDGNKRTAIIFANHFLISHGKGLIAIPSNLTDEYKKMLVDYYEGNDSDNIKNFLLNKCLTKF